MGEVSEWGLTEEVSFALLHMGKWIRKVVVVTASRTLHENLINKLQIQILNKLQI
jgi:hypothetical protein